MPSVTSHQHVHHAPTAESSSTTLDSSADAPTGHRMSTTPEWCAGHTSGVVGGLPAGLDGFAIFGELNLPTPARGLAVGRESSTAVPAVAIPPAPPPRLVA
jgi:hypothetical protein